MTVQKPKIQYIGQFYVYGSEAKAPALKQKKPRTTLPVAKPQQTRQIVVEPLALGGIVLAVVLLVALAVSTLELYFAWKDYSTMSGYVDKLTQTNVQLTETYRAGYDLSDIETHAQTLGMVPAEQATTVTIRLTPAKQAQEESLWDDIVWFFKGLLS